MALDEEFDLRLRALGTAAREAGFDPRITSGYRSGFDQARAINSVAQKVLGRPAGILDYARGIPGYAAPVGGSQHQKGLAADWATGPALDWLRQNAPRYGVRFPESLAKTDPIHSEIDSKFYGPVQDPRAREDQTVAAFDTKQPPTRMALGNPPAQAAPAPAPTGAPPMADPYRPQPRGGFLGLIDALQGGMSSPLFQSGAAMYSAASQGKDIGTGFMMGGEAAGRAAKSQADQAKMQRETMAQQQRDQMWQQLTSGQTPAWASNLPAGTLDLARALGPDAGATLISQMIGKTVDNYAAGDGFLYNKRTGETKALPADLKRPEDAKTSLQPMYGVDKDGNPVVLQTRSDGSVVQSKMPEGVTVARQPIKMDAGTHFVMLDPVTRQQIGIVPKDLEGKAVAEAAGEARGKAIVDLPRVEGLAQRIIKQVEDLEKDKRLPNILGLAARLPTFLPANVATEERAKQLSGAAFLQAFESLKGAGAITETEGEKATVALARLSNLRQDEAGYRQALSEFKAEVKRMLEMARERAKGGKPLPVAGGRGAPSGAGWSIERAD